MRSCVRLDSSERIRPRTSVQTRGVDCRNRRMVGYHGLSSRSRSQRQSSANGSITQTGRPSAPARWAVEAAAAITASSAASAAAVAANSFSDGARSVRVAARCCGGGVFRPGILLQAEQPHARHDEGRQNRGRRNGAPPVECVAGIAGPHHANGEVGGFADAPFPARDLFGIGCEIGNGGGDAVEPRSEHMRQAHQRQMNVEGGERIARATTRQPERLQQTGQRALALDHDGRRSREDRERTWQTAAYLQDLFGVEQRGAPPKRFASPFGTAKLRSRGAKRCSAAPLGLPAGFVIALHQQRQAWLKLNVVQDARRQPCG